MEPLGGTRALDRHALVMAIWMALGLVAASLFSYGFGSGGLPFVLSAFAVLAAAFVGHVIVNAVYETGFTTRERALALAVYLAAVLAFGLASIVLPDFAARNFLPLSLGFMVILAGMVFYMVTHFGLRRTFRAFDVIRDFGPEQEAAGRARRGDPR